MLKKLKSLFIVEDENAGSKKESQPEIGKEKEQQTTSSSMKSSKSDFTPKAGSKPDDKFVDILLKAIDENNLEGFDYLEYKQSLDSLAKMDMDEATRYKSAFAMANTMGVTPEKLIKTAGFYVDILQKENEKFTGAVHNQMDKQVKGRQEKVKSLKKSISENEAKIEELKTTIEKDKNELQKVSSEIDGAERKVKETEAKFQYAYNSVLKQIVSDMEKMKSYLK